VTTLAPNVGPEGTTNQTTDDMTEDPAKSTQDTRLEDDEEVRETGDVHVSWIYRLKKAEAVALARDWGLPVQGGMKELRARLIDHHQTETTTPPAHRQRAEEAPAVGDRQPPMKEWVDTETCPTTKVVDPGVLCDRVRSWKLTYDGTSDAPNFLERLSELQEAYGYTGEQLLIALPELLRGKPVLWMRNNRHQWRQWYQFVQDFKARYYPKSYEEDLDSRIIARRQVEGESIDEFAEDLQTLIRRRGSFDERTLFNRVYQNLLPRYKL
jgi:hypothetical protein